jgi:hypothetical protein
VAPKRLVFRQRTEIARILGLKTGAAVSAQMVKAKEMERTNQKIRKDLKRIETLLNEMMLIRDCGE